MYFNENKVKPLGARVDGGKLQKKLKKSLGQLHNHDSDVVVSEEPTQHLFVSNSSVLCGVSPEELQAIFTVFDPNCQFVVFPNKRTYSFVTLSSVEAAVSAKNELNGLVPPSLASGHQPFIIAYVKNLPAKVSDGVERPKDLQLIEDFIDEGLEQQLIDFFLNNAKVESLKHRSVIHYGHIFDYDTNSASDATDSIPPIVDSLIKRLVDEGISDFQPDQVTANVYEPGHGIPSHYDTHSAFEEPIISLSLAADVVMEFKDGANSARISPVLLKRRSLCVMKGESRYRWKHGIVNRKYDVDPDTALMMPRKLRISLTFRKIRTEPCQCLFKEFCDWDRHGEMGIPNSDDVARRLEDSYVSEVYENISSHFDETRHSSWKAVKGFIDALPRFSVLYDVGCGNGKYLIPKDNLIKIGCDMCMGLCSIATKKDCRVVRSDALQLPFREGADAVICIAVLHHMSSQTRREQLIREIVRVLRPGGRACITVWSMDQSDSEYAKMRSNKEENGVEKLTDSASRLKVHDGKSFSQQDVLVPWTIDAQKETFLRYYHVFREGEMEQLVAAVPGCRLLSVEREQGNYVAFIEKE